jgi:hypothetical protein
VRANEITLCQLIALFMERYLICNWKILYRLVLSHVGASGSWQVEAVLKFITTRTVLYINLHTIR